MHILILVAGTNEESNSAFLAYSFAEGGSSAGGTVETMRLRDLSIDHFTLEHYDPTHQDEPDFIALKEAVLRADGIVIATPIWNFSVPAHLKNVIDRMGSFALDSETRSKGQLRSKPFFFIFTGGAPMIAWKALMYLTTIHLTEAIKYYHGIVIGRHFCPRCVVGRGTFGLVVDHRPESIAAARRKGERFARIVLHYKENGSLPVGLRITSRFFSFLYQLGNRIMYPIGRMQ